MSPLQNSAGVSSLLFTLSTQGENYPCEILSCFLTPLVLQFAIQSCPLLHHIGRSSYGKVLWKYFLFHHPTAAYGGDDDSDDVSFL